MLFNPLLTRLLLFLFDLWLLLRLPVGLRADGTVVVAGDNTWSQCNVGDWKDILVPVNSNKGK